MKKPLDVIAGLHTERDSNPQPKETGQSLPIPLLYQLSYRRTSLTRLSPYAPLIIAALALSGCSQEPVVRVQYIETHVYVPVPTTLTSPTAVTLSPGITYGQALGDLREGLTSCNADKAAIRTLKPPNPPINP